MQETQEPTQMQGKLRLKKGRSFVTIRPKKLYTRSQEVIATSANAGGKLRASK